MAQVVPGFCLWFDLINSPEGQAPMGSEITMSQNPRFIVRAAGSFKQKPGCSKESIDSLSVERLDYLCAGECNNPSNERNIIERIEVIKITPQTYAGEAISPLIQDVWKVFPCNSQECNIQFSDEDYLRDSIYYVRAIQEPTPAINGTKPSKENGYRLCKGSYRTNLNDDCLGDINERAWSSPIYINKP